jgi:hypothetical protein
MEKLSKVMMNPSGWDSRATEPYGSRQGISNHPWLELWRLDRRLAPRWQGLRLGLLRY